MQPLWPCITIQNCHFAVSRRFRSSLGRRKAILLQRFISSGAANTNIAAIEVEVPIFNIRGHGDDLDVDTNGFELVRWEHDFTELGPSLRDEAYPAMKKTAKREVWAARSGHSI